MKNVILSAAVTVTVMTAGISSGAVASETPPAAEKQSNMEVAPSQQSPNTWSKFKATMTYSGLGFTKTQRATIDRGEVIYTSSSTTRGLMFSCIAGRLQVAAAWEPLDFRESFSTHGTQVKGRPIDMRLDGGDKKGLGFFIYKPNLGAISSRKRHQAAKLYNAVVRGQEVKLYMSGKKPVTLDLPKPNTTFAEFGAECGLGKFAKKK